MDLWTGISIGVLFVAGFVSFIDSNENCKRLSKRIDQDKKDLENLKKDLEKIIGYSYFGYNNPSINYRLGVLESGAARLTDNYNNLKEVKTARIEQKLNEIKKEMEKLENE